MSHGVQVVNSDAGLSQQHTGMSSKVLLCHTCIQQNMSQHRGDNGRESMEGTAMLGSPGRHCWGQGIWAPPPVADPYVLSPTHHCSVVCPTKAVLPGSPLLAVAVSSDPSSDPAKSQALKRTGGTQHMHECLLSNS